MRRLFQALLGASIIKNTESVVLGRDLSFVVLVNSAPRPYSAHHETRDEPLMNTIPSTLLQMPPYSRLGNELRTMTGPRVTTAYIQAESAEPNLRVVAVRQLRRLGVWRHPAGTMLLL